MTIKRKSIDIRTELDHDNKAINIYCDNDSVDPVIKYINEGIDVQYGPDLSYVYVQKIISKIEITNCPSIFLRWKQMLAGEISFFKDFILSLDQLEEYSKDLRVDKSNKISIVEFLLRHVVETPTYRIEKSNNWLQKQIMKMNFDSFIQKQNLKILSLLQYVKASLYSFEYNGKSYTVTSVTYMDPDEYNGFTSGFVGFYFSFVINEVGSVEISLSIDIDKGELNYTIYANMPSKCGLNIFTILNTTLSSYLPIDLYSIQNSDLKLENGCISNSIPLKSTSFERQTSINDSDSKHKYVGIDHPELRKQVKEWTMEFHDRLVSVTTDHLKILDNFTDIE